MPFRIKQLLCACGCLLFLMLLTTWSGDSHTSRPQERSEKPLSPKFVRITLDASTTSSAPRFFQQVDFTKAQESRWRRPKFNFGMQPEVLFPENCKLDRCVKRKDVRWTMVHFIKTAAGNFLRREFLRRTWGSVRFVAGGRFATVFVVGNSEGNVQRILRDEHERYNDILQYDGPDDYGNIALKTLAGMQWAFEKLPQNFLYSSGDDDFMINLGNLQDVVDKNLKIFQRENWPEFPIICTYRTLEAAQPYRIANGTYKKWYISTDEYKWPYYPRGCFGGFYSASVRVIGQLYEISRDVPQLRVDDVWITGILRSKLGMPESMVVAPNVTVAEHLVGYRKRRARTRREFMMEDWHKVLSTFVNKKKTCFC